MLKNKQDYIITLRDFVDSLSMQIPSRYWWVTSLAAKNRFIDFYKGLSEIYLKQKKIDDYKIGSVKFFCLLLKKLGFLIVLAFYVTTKMFLYRLFFMKRWDKAHKILSDQEVTVFKTFDFKASFSEPVYKDLFWGNLSRHAFNQNIPVLTITDPINCLKQSFLRYDEELKTFPYYYFLSLSDICSALWTQMKGALFSIKRPLFFLDHNVSNFVNQNFKQEILSSGVFCDLLKESAFKRLGKTLKIKRVFIPFENNPWEKMVVKAMREVSTKTKIVANQHASFPLASVNMFIGENERKSGLLPDVIYNSGPSTYAIFKKYGCYENFPLKIGSGLRFNFKQDYKFKDSKSKTLLLALEGIKDVTEIVKYVHSQLPALMTHGYDVRIRCHPTFRYEMLKANLPFDLDLIPQFKQSLGPLAKDFESAMAVMYWGSTVGMEALKFGLPIINYEMGHLLSYDPLFECKNLKWTCHKSDQLTDILIKIQNLDDVTYKEELKLANQYLNEYFMENGPNVYNRYLEE